MRELNRIKHSRDNWKRKAAERAEDNRYLKKELARVKKERDSLKNENKEARARARGLETQVGKPAILDKADLVWLALILFTVAHISFRAVSRVLAVLAGALGIEKPPCVQTIINWVTRLSLVRIQMASCLNGPLLPCLPSSNGFIWMIDISIALGTGKILAILALRADHHDIEPDAPGLGNVHCIAVSVASSWTGEAIAAFLDRVIAVTGPPAAFLKDAGADLQKGVRMLSEQGNPSLCIDDISHFIANLLKWRYVDHPMFETFLSTCGRICANLKQTILACLTPPKTQTKARFMNVHRLVRWAERLLKLSPPGGAPKGSVLSKLRANIDGLPECKGFIKGFLSDALPLLKCQEILKTRGLSESTLAQCQPLIQSIASPGVRTDFLDYLHCHLDIARKLGLEKIGMPVASDPIECLFGSGKQHGTGEIKDANQIATRLPALCGIPTRAEAEQVVGLSVAEQQNLIGNLPSLTRQRRQVLNHTDNLDSLGTDQIGAHLELIPSAKNRSNYHKTADIPISYEKMSAPKMACREACG